MAELRRKIWVVESKIDSMLRGDGAPFPPDLSDHVASLRVTLLDLQRELEFMERHLPPEPSSPPLLDDCHGAASASLQHLLSVFPSLALPQSLPRWKTLARKKKWRVKCSVSFSPFSFGFADMPRAR